ncbi:MAG: hypothetical protein GY716_10840 [bacterium]|nr:hypothetical protein [bacterium]
MLRPRDPRNRIDTRQLGRIGVPLAVLLTGVLAALGVFFAVRLAGGPDPQPAVSSSAGVAVSANVLDFGTLSPDSTAVRQLVVRNDGDETIQASLSADDPAYRVEPAQLTLAPGEIANVRVVAEPKTAGDLTRDLRIRFGDDAGQQVVVALQAQSQVQLASADRGTRASQGETVERDAPVRNRGRAPSSAASGATDETQPRASRADDKINPPRQRGVLSTRRTQPSEPTAGTTPAHEPKKEFESDLASRPRRIVSTPVPAFNDPGPPPPSSDADISDGERASARRLSSGIRDAADLSEAPSDLQPEERDLFEDDLAEGDGGEEDTGDDSPEPEDPFTRPTLTISGVSRIALLGSQNTFSPQALGVVGADLGGALSLTNKIQFPIVSLALGESMLFDQTGGISGTFDPATGQVNLQLPLAAIDSDGFAAPMLVNLTTGLSHGRNEAGIVVELAGTARAPGSGLLKLVALHKIPRGYRNAAQSQLLGIEILARLDFGTEVAPSSPLGDWGRDRRGS